MHTHTFTDIPSNPTDDRVIAISHAHMNVHPPIVILRVQINEQRAVERDLLDFYGPPLLSKVLLIL